MTDYGVGEAFQKRAVIPNGVIRMMPPKFDKTFTSIVDARKELYKRVIGNKGSPIELYVYNLSNGMSPRQVGMGYRTIINQKYVVDGTKRVIWEPFSPRGGSLGVFYYLNKDGTLGAKR